MSCKKVIASVLHSQYKGWLYHWPCRCHQGALSWLYRCHPQPPLHSEAGESLFLWRLCVCSVKHNNKHHCLWVQTTTLMSSNFHIQINPFSANRDYIRAPINHIITYSNSAQRELSFKYQHDYFWSQWLQRKIMVQVNSFPRCTLGVVRPNLPRKVVEKHGMERVQTNRKCIFVLS